MSLDSSLEKEKLEVLKALHNDGSNSNKVEWNEGGIRNLSLEEKSDVKVGDELIASTQSSLSSEGKSIESTAGITDSTVSTTSTTSNVSHSGTSTETPSTPLRSSHKHSVSLILNDGDEDVEVAGTPRRGDDTATTSPNKFNAESLFQPVETEEAKKESKKDSQPELQKESHKEPPPKDTHKAPRRNSFQRRELQASILDSARGRGRGRSHTDDYDSDDAAIDGLFDITQYRRSTGGVSQSEDYLKNYHLTNDSRGAIAGDHRVVVSNSHNRANSNDHVRPVTSNDRIRPTTSNERRLHPENNQNRLGRPRSRSARSRSPISRLPMDTDDDYFDESDDDYDSDSNEELEDESNEENVYEDIDSSETSDDDIHPDPNVNAEIIKQQLEAERPPGFKEGSALTGPVLSNSKRIRRPSELDASLIPTNTMSLLAAIEAEQEADSTLTTGYSSRRNSSASPNRSQNGRGTSPGYVRMKQSASSPNRHRHIREPSPQQVEYAAYKRRIIHPNTAFDAGAGGAYPEVDIPYTSDHEEVRDAQRAAQLHMEISQIHSNTETRRMYRTMTRGSLLPLDEEDPNPNLPPLKSFIVATDLSPEATHALEWTIGTVLRDGNLLIVVCAFEEDGSGDSQAEETIRLDAMDKITAIAVKLLKKTRLQVHVAIEVLHCKSARHAITDITDHVSPTLVILGSRGRSALKGVLLGSFSNYIVERSSVPVMVARRKLQKAKNKGLNVRLANNLRHGTLSTAKID